MKFAAAVGCAGFPNFTELNVCLLREVFGNDLPIVVVDDKSQDTHRNEAVATRRDCYFKTGDSPRGHFAGDIQAFMDAVSLGEALGADIAIKMSQRAMVSHRDLRPIIEGKFITDPNCLAVMAGRPNPKRIRSGHQQYARFPLLTDIVFMRIGGPLTADFIKEEYEKQVREGSHYWECFVEVFWDRLRTTGLNGRIHLAHELTEHRGGMAPLYLRRYQNTDAEYAALAARYGITSGPWLLDERVKLTSGYDPRPRL